MTKLPSLLPIYRRFTVRHRSVTCVPNHARCPVTRHKRRRFTLGLRLKAGTHHPQHPTSRAMHLAEAKAARTVGALSP